LDFESQSTSFGLTVSMNIFDQFVREQNLTRNKVSRNNARADYHEAQKSVMVAIQKTYYKVEKATEQVKVSQENVNSASEDMNLAQEKYNLGSASILDLLDAQVSLKTAQVSLIRSKLDLNIAIAELENAMGVTR
jgi:outer membrane protein TolC